MINTINMINTICNPACTREVNSMGQVENHVEPAYPVDFKPNSKTNFSARVNGSNLSKDVVISKSNDIQKITCFLYLKCLQERAQKIIIFTNLAKSAILNLIFFRKKRGYSKPSTLANKRYQKNGEDQILQHTPLVFARKGA